MGRPAAVDAQRRTVDQARLRGTKIKSELGNFLSLDETFHGTFNKHHLVDNFRLRNARRSIAELQNRATPPTAAPHACSGARA